MATRKAFGKMTAGERAENLKLRMEQENIEVWAKQGNKSEQEIAAAIIITMRESTLTEMMESLGKLIQQIPGSAISRLEKAKLVAHHQWIGQEIARSMQYISETIEYAAQKCPNNLGNMKEALEDLAATLTDPLGGGPMTVGLQRFKISIGSGDYSRNQDVYSRVDIDQSYEKGFEAGYDRALKATSQNTTAFDDRNIDL